MHLRVVASALAGLGISFEEMAAINAMNWSADMDGYDPREHGDNATLREALLLAEDRLAWKADTTPLGTIVDAPRAVSYGLALHTIADFYAHSTYVPVAAYVYGGLDNVPPLDVACQDNRLVDFLHGPNYDNTMLWHAPRGYTPDAYRLEKGFLQCLISGAYPQGGAASNDGWSGRPGLPIHDDLAVDQPDAASVHASPMIPRRHPFAYPEVWSEQFETRERLATAHIRNSAERVRHGHPNPTLGRPIESIPDGLFPNEWKLPDGTALGARPFLRRTADGDPV